MISNAKLLVVDDNDDERSLLAGQLQELSFQVQTAQDGDEAIRLINSKSEKNEKFDVILLDIKMPKVDGFQVLKYVKEMAPETKVIMVTAFGDVTNAIESLRLGASDFVGKPFDLEDILTSVERVLRETISDVRP